MLSEILGRFDTFSFVLIRVASILFAAPFFGSSSVPARVRLGMAVIVSVIIAPVVGTAVHMPDNAAAVAVSVFREGAIGAGIGLAARLVFSAVELAGELAGVQMGYAVATVIDPQTQNQLSIVAQFYNLMAMLLFFSMNVHLVFIAAIKRSFELIPPYGFIVAGGVTEGLLDMGGDMFRIGVKVAAPLIVALLLTNIAMGILARTLPQFNVFAVGFPVTIAVGLIVMAFSMPFMLSVVGRVYVEFSHNIMGLLSAGAAR
ncbi:MAG: flagellar biosynthetic protein FliR [Deltaproteobacteria bacterium]|nr:flagellar biosynthetic protein FliR [Deltaproteobacteria bacterium]